MLPIKFRWYFIRFILLLSSVSKVNSDKDENKIRRDKVREMMVHAWKNYRLHAWGGNELAPKMKLISNRSVFGTSRTGATIIDAMDTLYLMGLKAEYLEGREWIEKSFTLDTVKQDISVFETNIRYVGGFLSLYALTGDSLFKSKAKYVADKLLPAFDTPTGIPFSNINFQHGYATGRQSMLSEFGTLYLEFVYLTEITDDPTYKNVVDRVYETLEWVHNKSEPYPKEIDPVTGKWQSWDFSIGAYGDSFYEYLLKAWIQSGYANESFKEKYLLAISNVIEKLIHKSPHGYVQVGRVVDDRKNVVMEHLTCFTGGLFALSANTSVNKNLNDKYMKLGKEITRTCHESYVRTYTRLGPETFSISDRKLLHSTRRYYILRPEAVESYFYLWRITHDQKYRDWGWELVNALEKHCRIETGYCGIIDVYAKFALHDDLQHTFFLAETLKYLYLLFSDDSLLPLDKWVFNTEAHPLPIMNENHLKCVHSNVFT